MELVKEINIEGVISCSPDKMAILDLNWTTPTCQKLFFKDSVEFHRLCIMLAYASKEYLFTFVFDSVIMGSLCLIGATGNILSVLVLSQDFSRTTRGANVLLRGLCVADTGFLINYFFYSSLRNVFPLTGHLRGYYHFFPNLVRYLWTAAMTTQMAANWLVVLVTMERYTAIWRPFYGVKWQQTGRARIAFIAAVTIAMLFNIPRLFEWEVLIIPNPPCSNYTMYAAVDSSLRKNMIYAVVYRLLLYMICVAGGPLLLLGFMNIRLIGALRRAGREHMALTLHSPSSAHCLSPARRDRSRNVTVCIVIIVCVFFICETPALVHQILAAAGVHFPVSIQMYSVTLSNGLVVIKSSVNFLIYCMCGRKFRLLLRRLWHRRGFRLPTVPIPFASWIREIQEQIRSHDKVPTERQDFETPVIMENLGRQEVTIT